jgi:hypothetical protein
MNQEDTGPVRRLGVRFVLALVMIAGIFAMSAASVTAQDPTVTNASVRIVHASPDAPEVDVIIDGAMEAESLAFGEVTQYLSLSPRSHQVQIVPSGSGVESAVIDTTIDPEGGNSYIVAVTGLLNELEFNTYELNLTDLEDRAQSRLRIINLSPDVGDVDFYIAGGDELFDNIGFRTDSEHVDLDAGRYDFEVREHDTENTWLSAPGIEIIEGRSYDLLLIGQVADQSLAVLPLETTVDAPCSEVLGIGTANDACIRVLHASPGAPAVDVYVNESLIIEGLEFGVATEFAALPGGDDRTIQIVPTGSPIGDAVIDISGDFDAGRAYQVVAVDTVENIDAMVDEVDLSPVPPDQARLRVIHASPGGDGVDVVVTDGPTLFEGVNFRDVADYEVLDAGVYDIQIRSGDNVLIRVQDLELDSDMVYDVFAIGRSEDNTFAIIALTAPTEPRASDAEVLAAETPGAIVDEATPETIVTPDA